jgi:hypothetical protein
MYRIQHPTWTTADIACVIASRFLVAVMLVVVVLYRVGP